MNVIKIMNNKCNKASHWGTDLNTVISERAFFWTCWIDRKDVLSEINPNWNAVFCDMIIMSLEMTFWQQNQNKNKKEQFSCLATQWFLL